MEAGLWVHEPLHAVLEAIGAVVALLVAWLLIALERRGEGTSCNPQIVAALVSLGTLDAFHAAGHPGDLFVWFRSSASLACGAFAMMAWLPRPWFGGAFTLPVIALVGMLVFGGASWAGREVLPVMVEHGHLTAVAVWMNLVGGSFLVLAGTRMGLIWRTSKRPDDLLFFFLGTIAGASAITLAHSQLWGETWWVAHGIRFAANLGGFWLVAMTDARAQRKAEQASRALQDLNTSLEVRVRTRTEELEITRDAAQAASRAKSAFLANMSHEVRTPLNAVIGLTDVVMRTDLSEFQRDHLRTVMDSGNSLLQVINDILDFSKIEAGKMEVEHIPFNLEDAICDTLKLLAVRAQAQELELACLMDPEVPLEVIGDPVRVRQVQTNLVSNAITYTEHGEVMVRVGLEAVTAQLQISVLDSGVGFDGEQLERLFESFEQADGSSTRRYGGTGLGLSICRELVRLMGGEIQAESEPGVGSMFSFTLPCRVPPHSRAQTQKAALAETLAGLPVLIVDDSATHRTTLETMIRSNGMHPVLASSAAEALRHLRDAEQADTPIRLVVSDLDMPLADGMALARQIRDGGVGRDTRIVLVTSGALDSELEHDNSELGIEVMLRKPVKQSELLQALADAVLHGDPGKSTRHSASPTASPPASTVSEDPLRILLVEDSVPNQKLAQAILATVGHEVEVAEHGGRALEKLRQSEFDVVLMDVQMPEMDGFQATAAIRAGETGDPDVPIIAMTAHALRGDREKCLEAGMDEYVSKPVQREELFAALARVTETARAAKRELAAP